MRQETKATVIGVGLVMVLVALALALEGCMDDDPCIPNEVRCDDVENAIEQCNADERWQVIDQCDEHEAVDLFEGQAFECCDIGNGPQCYMLEICTLQERFCFETKAQLEEYCEGVL